MENRNRIFVRIIKKRSKFGLFIVLVAGLFSIAESSVFAQSPPTLSINGSVFQVTSSYTLQVSYPGISSGQSITLCATQTRPNALSSPQPLSVNYGCTTVGTTDTSGIFSITGNFTGGGCDQQSCIGSWQEHVEINGISSNTISFTVTATLGSFTINNSSGGTYTVGTPWTLNLTSNLPNKDVWICAIRNGSQTCTPAQNLGLSQQTNAAGSWTGSKVFTSGDTGTWDEWAEILGVDSPHINFMVGACTAETDAAFCARLNKNCGQVSGQDNCSTARTVADCSFGAGCPAGETCGGGGVQNVCGNATTPPSQPAFSLQSAAFCPGGAWTLAIFSNLPNKDIWICAVRNGSQSCTPAQNLGLPRQTDASGSWSGSGAFSFAEVGQWEEWARIFVDSSNFVESAHRTFSVATICPPTCAANAGQPCDTNTNCGGSIACDGAICINGVDCTNGGASSETCGGGGVAGECGTPPAPVNPPDTTMYDLTRYNPLPSLSFSRLLCTLANWIVSIGLVLVVIMIALAGIIILSSRDNEQQRSKGKKALEGAIVGLIVLLLAKGIILVILGFLGVRLTLMTC